MKYHPLEYMEINKGNNIDVDPECLCNVIPTERSDEGSQKQNMRYLPYGRYDTNDEF